MDPRDARRRLDEDHAALETTCEEVRRCAAKGDWRECDKIWRRFSDQVEDHFRFEERELCPEFRANTSLCEGAFHRLAAERDQVRAALDRIGIELELKLVDRPAIAHLLGRLDDHMRHERRVFYPGRE